jgi:hypothetical protein
VFCEPHSITSILWNVLDSDRGGYWWINGNCRFGALTSTAKA